MTLRGAGSTGSLWLTGAIAALLMAACSKPSRPVSEPELIGKWTTVELISPRGHRGPANGILEARIEYFANHSATGLFHWNESLSTNAGDSMPAAWSGTWALTNGMLQMQQLGAAAPTLSYLWFEDDRLVLQPSVTDSNTASMTYISKRSD